jgi:predicted metal-dependent peptidase
MHSFPMPSGPGKSALEQLADLDPNRVDALKDRLSRVRTALTVWVPFFGHLLLKLDPRPALPWMRIPTMAVTRDRKLYVNLDFADKLTDAEFAGVLCHEVMHPAYLCWLRQGSRRAVVHSHSPCGACGTKGKVIIQGEEAKGPQTCPVCKGTGVEETPVTLWNIAHDYAINGIIDTMTQSIAEVALPKGGCMDHKYDNHSAEEIYDELLDQAVKNGQKGKGDGPTISLPNDNWGTDDMRDDLGGDGEGKGDEDGDGEGNGKGQDGQDGQDGQGQGGGEGTGGGQSRSESQNRALDQYWKVAVCEAAQVHEQQKGRGTLPGALQKLIDEITDPKISWIDVLSRWVGENGCRADFTYRRPSRRAESIGEILPALQKHGVNDIVVGWDTSGSMYGREKEILSEVIGICEDLNMGLRVICVDTAVHSDQEDVREVEDVDIKGGGGSDYTPMFELLDEEGFAGVVVCFTDGYIGVPEVKPLHIQEVLWVLWEGRDVDPTGGKWGETLIVDTDGNQVN